MTWRRLAFFLVFVGFVCGISQPARAACEPAGVVDIGKAVQAVNFAEENGAVFLFRHAQKRRKEGTRRHEMEPRCKGDDCLCKVEDGLTFAGLAQARGIGHAFLAFERLEVAGVYASPYCRTVQTAAAIFDIPAVNKLPELLPSTDAQLSEILQKIAARLDDNSSYIFVTHSGVLKRLLNVEKAPAESVGAVLRKGCYPETGQNDCIIACISHDRWPKR